jgi:hypothetical protein
MTMLIVIRCASRKETSVVVSKSLKSSIQKLKIVRSTLKIVRSTLKIVPLTLKIAHSQKRQWRQVADHESMRSWVLIISHREGMTPTR